MGLGGGGGDTNSRRASCCSTCWLAREGSAGLKVFWAGRPAMPNSRANTGGGAPCKGPCKAGPLHAWHSKGEVCSAKHLPAIPRATLPMRVQSLRSFSLAMQTMHPRSLPSQSSPQCRSCQAHNAGLGLARPALVLAWCCLGRQTMRVTLLALVFH